MAAPTMPQTGERAVESAWQGRASRGSGVHTRGKEEAAGGGGAQKRKRPEGRSCYVLGVGGGG